MPNPTPQADLTASPAADPERVLRMTRTFAAPRETVFRAWTDPARLAKWWGPEGMSVPVCDMDVRPGGAWRTCMRSPEGADNFVRGVYREIVAPEKLVFTWAWEADGVPGHETVVTVEFHERGASTELVLTQQVFETAKSCRLHHEGWSSSFDCLEQHLTGD